MSEHTKLVLQLGMTLLFGIPSAAFMVWAVWSLFWHLYDERMQDRTRARLRKHDPAADRNCYSDHGARR